MGAGPIDSSDLALMLLSDGRLPTGSHAQSAGLEPALQAGMPAAHVPSYLLTRLRTVTTVEAGAAVVARHHLVRGLDLDVVEAAWSARTPSDAVRRSSRTTGRGYLRLLRRLWPEHEVTSRLAAGPTPSRALALAGLAVVLDVSPERTARLVCYDDVQAVCAAALKLVPMEPALTVGWVLSMGGPIEEVVATVAHLTEPADIPACSAPLLDQWAQAHAGAPRRLFHG